MPEIGQLGNAKKQYTLQINPADYTINANLAPISAFKRVISYEDDTDPINVDPMRLAPVFAGIRAKDFKYYFYMLAHLVRNDLPVKANHREMRELYNDKSHRVVENAIERLVQSGLIFRAPHRRGEYIVNPVFAWKGNRLDYLDLSSFEDHT